MAKAPDLTGAAAAAPAVTLESIRAAAATLAGVAVRTPMVDAPELGRLAGVPVALKCEQLQPVGAFKARGAYTAIARLPDERRRGGVVASSSGNHAQGVAWAARRFGVRAVVVMPESTPAVKVAGVRSHGGEVVFAGATRSPEQQRRAEELAAAEGLAMIPPFDHPDVIAGQGTCGLEIAEQMPEVRVALVPVSGGGLLSGTATALAALRPGIRVIGVEPEGAAKLTAALAAGEPVRLERTASLADGLLTPSVGSITFPLIRRVVREAVRVTEDEIVAAMRFLYGTMRLVVEPSGAVTTAALLAGKVRPEGPVAAVVSGGNVDPELFHRLVTPA